MRYEVWRDREDDGIVQYLVDRSGRIARPARECVRVWVGTDGKARCVSCQGKLVAMSASCKHAKAVTRFLKREASKEGNSK